ncbi:hypothetical protein D9757_001987 [Collybiopsis confluens]|uniref:Regulator of volume decrease after cellular swelling-domain-containing protein n=1 Tax=Collybiopsis confluens TaxID=2823264 RepID=A0A8H5MER3_9AGAR|nr:hypothetical protein D9757_001987 [Collybiopsis confluens]
MAATLIDCIPKFSSPEEHKALVGSTPASFNDIPPVLRHKEESVSVTLVPSLDGLTEEDAKEGTLYVLESVLVFMSRTGKGFQIEYPSITLHAVSRRDASPSIYCQLDESSAKALKMLVDTADQAGGNVEDEDENNEDELDMRELNVIPKNIDALEPIFDALSLCAALHPDPPGSDDDENDFDEAFIDAPGDFEVFAGTKEEELSEAGKVRDDFMNSNRYAPY